MKLSVIIVLSFAFAAETLATSVDGDYNEGEVSHVDDQTMAANLRGNVS